MNTKQSFRLGLQWGALAWLGYIAVQSVRESSPLMFAWAAALGVLACSSRWGRGVVALGIFAQLACGLVEAARIYPPEVFADISVHRLAMSWLWRSGVALCLPLVPLVAWRAEPLRVTVALLAMGRWRDAWTRSGGTVALLAAAPVIAINRATLDLCSDQLVPLGLVATALLLVRYGDVIMALPTKGRQPG